jgi:integrase
LFRVHQRPRRPSYDAAHSRWKKYRAAAGTGIRIHQLRHAHATEFQHWDKVTDTEIRAACRKRETGRR